MSAPGIAFPGTRYGPCEDEGCEHQDCRLDRMQAACVCPFCGDAIGYGNDFFVVGSPQQLAHESCMTAAAEKERSEMASSEEHPESHGAPCMYGTHQA
jgi:hypothetical protein